MPKTTKPWLTSTQYNWKKSYSLNVHSIGTVVSRMYKLLPLIPTRAKFHVIINGNNGVVIYLHRPISLVRSLVLILVLALKPFQDRDQNQTLDNWFQDQGQNFGLTVTARDFQTLDSNAL